MALLPWFPMTNGKDMWSLCINDATDTRKAVMTLRHRNTSGGWETEAIVVLDQTGLVERSPSGVIPRRGLTEKDLETHPEWVRAAAELASYSEDLRLFDFQFLDSEGGWEEMNDAS